MSMPPEPFLHVAGPRIRAELEGDCAFTPLGWSASATYRVDAKSGTYLLRLHAPVAAPFEPGYSTDGAIQSECAWLAALDRDTKFNVPTPVSMGSNGFVFDVQVEGKTVLGTLLTWVPGRVIEGRRTQTQAAQLAELLAALQQHGQTWDRPKGFERPTLDRRWVREAVRRIAALSDVGLVEPEHLTVIRGALRQAESELLEYEQRGAIAGLIHADLHGDNYVEHAGHIAPIDFGRAAIGPWLLDLAECSLHLFPDRRGDLLDAYSALQPWPDGAERLVEGYAVQAIIESFGYNAANPDTREGVLRSIPGICAKHFARYLAGEPFLRQV